MKLLLLMPCDEKFTYLATGVYKALPAEWKEKCFCMPMFMQYVMETKLTDNWTKAFFYTMVAAEQLYESSGKEDFLLIGNIGSEYPFDAVFNMQDEGEALPYQDLFIEKVKEVVKDEPMLVNYIAALHGADESKMALQNCTATADFLVRYIESDPHLEKIDKAFEHILDERKRGELSGLIHKK